MSKYDGRGGTATSLICHYFRTFAEANGQRWTHDNDSEVKEIVDAIIAEAVARAKATPPNIFQLIATGENQVRVLFTAKSSDRLVAFAELSAWAAANGHKMAKSSTDPEATCYLQETFPLAVD